MLHPLRVVLSVLAVLGALLVAPQAQADDRTMSFNDTVPVVPAPGPVVIDGKIDDWDLSGGVWSYNDPTIVDQYSVWTHLMWDAKGVYFLARFHDRSPMQNAASGKDFAKSWQADCYQARVIFDDHTPDEHQMHVNMYWSSTDQAPYMIVHHGGMRSQPPFDQTGPARDDQLAKFGPTMAAAGGAIACRRWADGQGYDMECFWPWSFCRTAGVPLAPGDHFTFGIEALWGSKDGTQSVHRLADGIKDETVNRIFMFRARDGWGRAVLAATGKLPVANEQRALQQERAKRFLDYDTYGSIPLTYALQRDSEVTIAIDDATGKRVRHLFGQFPRSAGSLTDHWDGLDDAGNPVTPGDYNATIVHHQPIGLTFHNSVYSSATPPWTTEHGSLFWGSNHGHPTSVATRQDATVLFFTGTEGGSGIQRIDDSGKILWTDGQEFIAGALDDHFAYGLSRSSWQNKTLLIRYDLQSGRLTPFADAEHSPSTTLLPDAKIDDGTLASAGGALWALFPGRTMQRRDPATGALTKELSAGMLIALATVGEQLIALRQDGAIVALDGEGAEGAIITRIAGLTTPVRLAVDPAGERFLISDHGTNQVVLCDRTGHELHRFGHAYPGNDRPAGTFITTDLIRPMGTGFDHLGRIWIPEGTKNCKRVGLWSADGALLDQFWGQADYGAMSGFAIIADSSRFIAHGIEFKLDAEPDPWQRKTREQPLIYHPSLNEESGQRGVVYSLNGHDYAAGAPLQKGTSLIIFRRDEHHVFVPCASLESGDAKPGEKKAGRGWVDRNGDGIRQDDEVVTTPPFASLYWSNGYVRPDLAILTVDGRLYVPTGFGPGGVPLYDFTHAATVANWPKMTGQASIGTPVMDAAGTVSNGIAWMTVDGRSGSYPNPYGRHDAPAARRGLLIAPFRANGVVEGVPGVGAVTALGGDRGQWFLLSTDGLYLSSLCQDIKANVTPDETLTGAESFGGLLWRDGASGKVLVQLGGASYRLMEVTGLETCAKERITVHVSDELIRAGTAIAQERQRQRNSEPDRLRIAAIRGSTVELAPVMQPLAKPLIDGAVDVRVSEDGNPAVWWRAALAIQGKDLVAMWQVADPSPWLNGQGQFTHAFIGGDAVDLQLDIPGRGPVRILGAKIGGKDTVVYSQAKESPGVPAAPVTYAVANNLANATTLAVVKRLDGAVISSAVGITSYTVLIRVPLATLGLEQARGTELRGQIGVIYSDQAGTNRTARLYWHNKDTGLVADVPSEARLEPKRWGPIDIDR